MATCLVGFEEGFVRLDSVKTFQTFFSFLSLIFLRTLAVPSGRVLTVDRAKLLRESEGRKAGMCDRTEPV